MINRSQVRSVQHVPDRILVVVRSKQANVAAVACQLYRMYMIQLSEHSVQKSVHKIQLTRLHVENSHQTLLKYRL